MKSLLSVLIILILSVLIGGGLALYSIKNIGDNASFMLYNGPWRVNPVMDLKNAKQRALIAKVGLFALRETEVIYFSAVKDSEGKTLNAKYDYLIEGSVPKSRYWSYTIYGEDDFLIPNEDRLYGYNQKTIRYTQKDTLNPEFQNTAQRTYKMYMSQKPKKENWLPAGNNDKLTITLRLYNPSAEVYKNLLTVPLPSIKRVL